MRNDRIDEALVRSLSRERLTKYVEAATGDVSAALALYERNLRLAEAFHTPLHCFEIALRNRIDDRMTERFGEHWLHDPAVPLAPDARAVIARAEAAFPTAPATEGAIVAELNLGFWVGLLGPRYDDNLWRQTLHAGFRVGGRPMKRRILHGRLNALRRFRNRIAHHEPIFDRNLPAVHAEIIEAVSWICPDTAAWADFNSRFAAVYTGP